MSMKLSIWRRIMSTWKQLYNLDLWTPIRCYFAAVRMDLASPVLSREFPRPLASWISIFIGQNFIGWISPAVSLITGPRWHDLVDTVLLVAGVSLAGSRLQDLLCRISFAGSRWLSCHEMLAYLVVVQNIHPRQLDSRNN